MLISTRIATFVCSDPSFSLFKLADKRPLPEPRGALFDICTENFHYALPVDSVMTRLEGDDLGQLLSEPARGCPSAAAPGPAQGALPVPQPAAPAVPETKTAPSELPAKPPKQKEKKGKKEKEKKVGLLLSTCLHCALTLFAAAARIMRWNKKR